MSQSASQPTITSGSTCHQGKNIASPTDASNSNCANANQDWAWYYSSQISTYQEGSTQETQQETDDLSTSKDFTPLLPPELHHEILYHLLLSGDLQKHNLHREVHPYLIACPSALACWRANKRIILHRAAQTRLRDLEQRGKELSSKVIRQKFRWLVWKAASTLAPNAEREYWREELWEYFGLQALERVYGEHEKRVRGLRWYLLR